MSELQLAYNTYHPLLDPMGNLHGDCNQLGSGAKTHFLSIGGNSLYGMRTLAQWKGFTYEKNIPYDSAKDVISLGLAEGDTVRSDAAKLEKGYIVDLKQHPDAVKRAIMEYGAVVVTYEQETVYYNADTNSYRNPYENPTNHACVIVGWDDTYPAYQFGYPATHDGAWLVRNSGTTKNEASNLGYFWMSYEDASLSGKSYVLDFMPVSRYDHNYQYDGAVSTSAIKAEAAANIFTARNMHATGSETLDAVMISFDGATGVNYQIDIYTRLKDGQNPESGYRHPSARTIGTLEYAGIYTIPLKKKVYLAPGETFSVVVRSLNGKQPFDCERGVNRTYADGTARFDSVAHADSGESFYKRKLTDTNWKDCGTDRLISYGNMCIKALTKDSDKEKYLISYELNGGKGNQNPVSYLSTSEGFQLQAPKKEGHHFLGWYTDEGFCNQISTVDGSTASHLMLYAQWGAHEYAETVIAKTEDGRAGVLRKTCRECGFIEEERITTKVSAKIAGSYNQVKVSWTKAPGAKGYYVYYKKAKGSYSVKKMKSVRQRSTTFTNLASGENYTFQVVPYYTDKTGCIWKGKAGYADVKTLRKVVSKKIRKSSSKYVKIGWYKTKRAIYYEVSKSKTKNGTYLAAKKVKKDYVKLKAIKGQPYWYKVRACFKIDGKEIKGPWSEPRRYTRQKDK